MFTFSASTHRKRISSVLRENIQKPTLKRQKLVHFVGHIDTLVSEIAMEKDITFDYVLNNVVGAAGKYQWLR